jgi:hypothetical protein
MGSGLPQFGFPRRFAIGFVVLKEGVICFEHPPSAAGDPLGPEENLWSYFKDFFSKNQ